MPRTLSLLLVLAGLLSGMSVPAASAQRATGTVTGVVTDADGLPVAYVNVGLPGTALGAATDERGHYTIFHVPSGAQTLTASAVGFAPVTQRVDVAAGASATVDFTLEQTVGELGEVIVTGLRRRTSSVTKTMTPLEDLPISVGIVGEALMHQQQAIDLRDVVRNVSGVTATGSYNGGYVYYNSRGFDMSNWSNFRRNGMFVWNMGHHWADNIEQVEVLKGPASVLYGDVAPGGVMNFVTKKPLSYRYARVEMKAGQYGLLRPSVDVSGPLVPDGDVLYRLNASYERSGSFRDEVESEVAFVAPSLTWKVTPRLHWNVEASYKRDDRVGDPGLISPDGTFDGLARIDRSTFLGEPDGTYTFEDKSAFSTVGLYLDARWSVRNVTYYTDTYRTPYNVYLDGTSASEDGLVTRTQYNYNQWFRGWGTDVHVAGSFATGPLEHGLVVGADYMFNHSRFTNGIDAPLAGAINIFEPVYGQTPLDEDPMEWADSRFFYRRYGLYAQDQISLLQGRVQALLGLRFSVSTTGDRYDDPADEPEGYEPPTNTPVSPRLGLVVKPVPNLSLYASFAEAFEVNGLDWIETSVVVPPTSSQQLEIGAKSSLLDERLGVSVALFQIEKEGIYGWITTDTAPSFPYIGFDEDWGYATYVGGLHRSRGVEVDVDGRPVEGLTVNASAALIDATVVEDPAYASGNALSGQPRASFSAWTTYAVPAGRLAGLELGGGVFHRGSFYQSTDNDPAGEVDPYTSLDATAAYTLGRVTARLSVQNLTDATGYLSSFGVYEPLWPRRVLLSVAARF